MHGTQHTFYIPVSDGRRPASFLCSFSFTITCLSFYSLAPDFSWHLGTGLRSPSVWGPERCGGPCERRHQSLVFWGWEPPAGLGHTVSTCEEGAFLQIGVGGRSGAGGGAVTTHRGPEIQPQSLRERGERPSQGACLELQGWRDRATGAPTRKLVCRLPRGPPPPADGPPPSDSDLTSSLAIPPNPVPKHPHGLAFPAPGSRGRADEDGVPAAYVLGGHPAGGCQGSAGGWTLRVRTPDLCTWLLPPARPCLHLSARSPQQTLPAHTRKAHTPGTRHGRTTQAHTHVTPCTYPLSSHHIHQTGTGHTPAHTSQVCCGLHPHTDASHTRAHTTHTHVHSSWFPSSLQCGAEEGPCPESCQDSVSSPRGKHGGRGKQPPTRILPMGQPLLPCSPGSTQRASLCGRVGRDQGSAAGPGLDLLLGFFPGPGLLRHRQQRIHPDLGEAPGGKTRGRPSGLDGWRKPRSNPGPGPTRGKGLMKTESLPRTTASSARPQNPDFSTQTPRGNLTSLVFSHDCW